MLRKSLLVVCAVAFLCALAPGTATAQDNNWNQRTFFTFSAPVELPGKTLPAGTYLFRIVDSPSNRHVIQVFDKDEKEIHATILAIPAQRDKPSDEPEVRFMETAATQPAAIRMWWFPGRTIGHEFIYPKEQAARLARGATAPVLTVATEATTTETMREAELARITAAGETQTAVIQPAPTTPSEPTTVPQRTEVTQRPVETAPAPEVTTEPVTTVADDTTRRELPRTATFLPLLALIGLGSLAGAAALRLRRK
jgi:hypothetical protein